MYYARGLKDLIKTTELSIEFFLELDEFSIHYIEMAFKQLLDDHMGMLTELEDYNYQLFKEFKLHYFSGFDEGDFDYLDDYKKAS
jgi:hypothetical protein